MTLSSWEDHQCWVNLWNLVLWWHDLYISEQYWINFPYLGCEWMLIYNLSFIHSIHDGLLQVFIILIWVIVERFLNLMLSEHSCGVGFWLIYWAKWATEVSKFPSYCTFWSTSYKCCSILFLRVFWVFRT